MFEKWRRPGRSPKEGRLKKLFSYVVFGAICLVFVFLAPMGTQMMGGGVFGYVGGEPIRAAELRLIEENIRLRYKAQLERADEKSHSRLNKEIRELALRQLIKLYLLALGARREGFFLSDQELRAEIRSMPVFQQEGRFLYSRYLSYLKGSKLSPSRFEERIRKAKLAENWTDLFTKSAVPNVLELEKQSQRRRYKMSFRYAELKAGEIKERDLEPLAKAGDLRAINSFLKSAGASWEETGEFSFAFPPPAAQNEDVMEAFVHHLPAKGLIPRLIRQGDKIYIVEALSFREQKAVPRPRKTEKKLSLKFDKSSRLFNSWMNVQRTRIKVKLSDQQ